MNDADTGALILLNTLAAANTAMIEIAAELRKRSGSTKVIRRADVRKYQSGPIFEAYVEVELADGEAYCWWFEITQDNAYWHIEATIRQTGHNRQEIATQFPTRISKSIMELRLLGLIRG